MLVCLNEIKISDPSKLHVYDLQIDLVQQALYKPVIVI